MTGISILGKISVAVRRITKGLRTRMRSAITIKVYGRLRASLTIHIRQIFGSHRAAEPPGNGLRGANQSGQRGLPLPIRESRSVAINLWTRETIAAGSGPDDEPRKAEEPGALYRDIPLYPGFVKNYFPPCLVSGTDSGASKQPGHRYFCFPNLGLYAIPNNTERRSAASCLPKFASKRS
jgi:hypothetical protein